MKPNPCKRCGSDAFVKKLHDGSYYITCERCAQAVGALYRMEVRSDKESDGTLGWNAMNPVAEPEKSPMYVKELGQAFGLEPEKVVEETCGNCRFYSGVRNTCRRFPKHEVTDKDHWCGEWRAK